MINNIKLNNYKKALVEVDVVLACLQYEEYIKIPRDIIDAIKINKNEEYIFEYDEELDYTEWDLMPETKAILYNIFKKYLATDEQKKYFIEKEKFQIMQLEREKTKKYKADDLFDKKRKNIIKENESSKALLEIKEEKWYKKIFSLIKKFLKK